MGEWGTPAHSPILYFTHSPIHPFTDYFSEVVTGGACGFRYFSYHDRYRS